MDVPLAAPSLDETTLDEAERVLREEFFLGGETVDAFEGDLRSYFGVDHAVTVDSGTRALQFALEGLGIGEGDTVVTTPATFVATANVIVRTGATPRFVDIDIDTYGPDIEQLERVCRTESVDAVMPVHLYGHPMDIDRIRAAAGDVPIVSDACQSHGARRDGYKIGSRSDAAGLSFYPSKNMTVAGDGGVLLTDDDEIARIASSLRDVGRRRDTNTNGSATPHGSTRSTPRSVASNSTSWMSGTTGDGASPIGTMTSSPIFRWFGRRPELLTSTRRGTSTRSAQRIRTRSGTISPATGSKVEASTALRSTSSHRTVRWATRKGSSPKRRSGRTHS
mgnify:CR=1 FL=1